MTLPLLHQTPLQEAFAALRRELIHEDGPRISTMRNYRLAIVQYQPKEEFKLRGEVQHLSADLMASGWMVLSLNLQALLLDRVRAQGADWAARVIAMETSLASKGGGRGLNYLKSRLTPLIEGPDGIAADCSRIIGDYVDRHPDTVDRTVALIGRAGALYPFFRSSALLRHLDGRTRNVPVVLLYPGERRGPTGLSLWVSSIPTTTIGPASIPETLMPIRDLFRSDVTRVEPSPNRDHICASRRVTTDVAANSPGHALRRAQAPMLGRPRFPDAAPILERRRSAPVSDLMPRVHRVRPL